MMVQLAWMLAPWMLQRLPPRPVLMWKLIFSLFALFCPGSAFGPWQCQHLMLAIFAVLFYPTLRLEVFQLRQRLVEAMVQLALRR